MWGVESKGSDLNIKYYSSQSNCKNGKFEHDWFIQPNRCTKVRYNSNEFGSSYDGYIMMRASQGGGGHMDRHSSGSIGMIASAAFATILGIAAFLYWEKKNPKRDNYISKQKPKLMVQKLKKINVHPATLSAFLFFPFL